jgi:cell division protein FtsB
MTGMDNLFKISPFFNHPLRRMFLSLSLILFLMGCTPIYTSRTGEDLSRSIADLEKRIAQEKDSSVRAKYHLQLAWLYSNYKNPKMDYRKALEEFEVYLSMAPDGAQTDEIQNWLSVLRALELSKEKSEMLTRENFETRLTLEDQVKKNQQLQENIEKLLNRNASLKENNASLKEAIERLKTLNLQVEKKRKSAK